MRLLYIAKHASGGNDDEGAIAYAFEKLGHSVTRVDESNTSAIIAASRRSHDLTLFHKWDDPALLQRTPGKKAFWYFDLVDYPDRTLQKRCEQRKAWMARTMPLVDAGFCTDGDWAKANGLQILRQGADERTMGPRRREKRLSWDILFVGDSRGGEVRSSWHRAMTEKYGGRYCNIRGGCHGTELRNAISRSPIVVAPDAPITDSYWSNRVYVMMGMGAFLIHPFCKALRADIPELQMYKSREHLYRMIEHYMEDEDLRERIALEGYHSIAASHTYRHRCQELLRCLNL